MQKKNPFFDKSHSSGNLAFTSKIKTGEKNLMFDKTRSERSNNKMSIWKGTVIYVYFSDKSTLIYILFLLGKWLNPLTVIIKQLKVSLKIVYSSR